MNPNLYNPGDELFTTMNYLYPDSSTLSRIASFRFPLIPYAVKVLEYRGIKMVNNTPCHYYLVQPELASIRPLLIVEDQLNPDLNTVKRTYADQMIESINHVEAALEAEKQALDAWLQAPENHAASPEPPSLQEDEKHE